MGINGDLKKKYIIIIFFLIVTSAGFRFYAPTATELIIYTAENASEKFNFGETKDNVQINQSPEFMAKSSKFKTLNLNLFFPYAIAAHMLIGNNNKFGWIYNISYQIVQLNDSVMSTLFTLSDHPSNIQISKDNGIVTVKNENEIVIYSGSDDVDAIETALSEIDTGNILFKKATYDIDRQVLLKSNVNFIGNEDVIFNCCFNDIAFNTEDEGYSSSTTLLQNDVHSGDTQIKLSALTGLNVGDYLKISDDFGIFSKELDFQYEGTTQIEGKSYFRNGEIVKITAIDGTKITIDKPLYDNYSTTQNAKIRKISMFRNITFENIDFIGYGMETNSKAIYFYGAQNCKISDCEFTQFGNRAINFLDCLDCVVEKNIFRKIFMTGIGYSVYMGNACDNITIINNSFLEKGRHYIAVGGSTGTKISDGLCRNVSVVNNIFENSTDEAINTHPSTRSMFRVVNNKFFNCRKGITFFNSDSIIMNNTFVSCVNGIEVYNAGNHLIKGNYFQGNQKSCVLSASSVVRDNLFDNGGYILPIFDVVIDENKFKNYSAFIIYSQGTTASNIKKITISNNICEDELVMPIKLQYGRDISLMNNDLKGYIEFRNCGDVRTTNNNINSSSYCGIRVWNAEGSYEIISNEITANRTGVSLENTGENPITHQIIIRNNEINAPTAVHKDGYLNVIIEQL